MDLKKPYSINEQIKKLEEHGVVVDDVELTRNVLQQISYYRLSGYILSKYSGNMYNPSFPTF